MYLDNGVIEMETINDRWKLLVGLLARTKSQYRDELMDEELVYTASLAMEEKLDIARTKGRGGWWSEDCCTENLRQMLKEHVEKGDMRDVMNLAAMIYYRESVGIGENV